MIFILNHHVSSQQEIYFNNDVSYFIDIGSILQFYENSETFEPRPQYLTRGAAMVSFLLTLDMLAMMSVGWGGGDMLRLWL